MRQPIENFNHARTFVGKKIPQNKQTPENTATINWSEVFSKNGKWKYTAYQSTGKDMPDNMEMGL